MKKTNLLKVILAVVLSLFCVCFTGCDLVKGAIGGIINSGGLNLGGGSSDCQHENYVGRQQAPTCTEDGADLRLCANCGKILEKTTIPALGHDYVDGVCTRCGKDENNDCEHANVSDWIIDKKATCTQEGSRYKKCSDCGAKIQAETIPALGHDIKNDVCTRCGISIKNCKHLNVSDWIVDKQPTCAKEGSRTIRCRDCNAVIASATIGVYGHYFENDACTRCGTDIENCEHIISGRRGSYTVPVSGEPATCTKDGFDEPYCPLCRKIIGKTILPALGHDYVNGICTHCGKNENGRDDCKHEYVSDWIVDKEATCAESGNKHKECTGCGSWVEREKIIAVEHIVSEWVVTKQPTCTKSGSRYNYCTVCSKSIYTETIIALGHKYENGTCTRCSAKENSNGDTYTRDGNYIYFGSYPQTKVTDSVIINALDGYKGTLPSKGNNQGWNRCQDYLCRNNLEIKIAGMWYKDVNYNGEKYRAVYFENYRAEDAEDDFGADVLFEYGYIADLVYWFKYEPIKWRILTEKNGSAFLMSEIAIDGQAYYSADFNSMIDDYYLDTIYQPLPPRTVNGKSIYFNNYAESTIREWLNKTFYTTAFSSLQQSLIKTTLVDNSAASTYPHDNPTGYNEGKNEYACENTNDKIFLLSVNDVTNDAYGLSKTNLQLKCSDYSKSQGLFSMYLDDNDNYGNCVWSLRSPVERNNFCAQFIDYDGDYCDYPGTSISVGVVPALWINL